MFENTCSDLFSGAAAATGESNQVKVKGAILAHNMGLGKSLQLCAFLHTFLSHPAVPDAIAKQATATSGVQNSSTTASSWHGNTISSMNQSLLMNQCSLLRTLQDSRIRRALLCVPVNTIANWENEWSKWLVVVLLPFGDSHVFLHLIIF